MKIKAAPQYRLSVGKAFIVAVMVLSGTVTQAWAGFSLTPATQGSYTFQDQCSDGSFDQLLQQKHDMAMQAELQALHAVYQMNPAPSVHNLFDFSRIQQLFSQLSTISDPQGLAGSVISSTINSLVESAIQQLEQQAMQKMMSQLGQLGGIVTKLAQAMCTPQPTLAGGLQGLQQQAALVPGSPFCTGNPIFGTASSGAVNPSINFSNNISDWFNQQSGQ